MRLFFALILAAAAAAASAQVAAPPADPAREAFRQLQRGRYLDAVEGLRAAIAAGAPEPAPSLLAQIEPFLTGVPPTPANPAAGAPASAAWSTAERRDAIAAIVERARRTSIVILNEAHNTPRHRAFALEVARALRPLGYSILAMETLTNQVDRPAAEAAMAALVRDGYPRLGTGTYLMEPVFGDFLRQALALGYRPVAYEETGSGPSASRAERIAARDQAQAQNLVDRIFAGTPDARVLIYVGYGHVAEAPMPEEDGGSAEWMAARLKRMTGIDPLTIDQTAVTEYSAERRADYDAAAARIGAVSSVFLAEGRPIAVGRLAHAVDLQIVHPRTQMIGGRPDWLRGMGRTLTPVPQGLLPRHGRRLVQAFVASEAADAVPVDQVVVEAGLPPPSLMLPAGPVRFAHQDPSTGPAR